MRVLVDSMPSREMPTLMVAFPYALSLQKLSPLHIAGQTLAQVQLSCRHAAFGFQYFIISYMLVDLAFLTSAVGE